MTNKVFGIGWGRTGTKTLGRCLEILGYNHYSVNLDLVLDVKEGDFSRIFDIVENHDSFEDWPWPLIYKELDEAFPNSKFILTTRDPMERLKSYQRLLSKETHTPEKLKEIRKYIYGYQDLVGHEEEYVKGFIEHNRQVHRYFSDRPEDLLVIDWSKGHGWPELCGFLDKPIPETPLPWIHKSKQATALEEIKLKIMKTAYNIFGHRPINQLKKLMRGKD